VGRDGGRVGEMSEVVIPGSLSTPSFTGASYCPKCGHHVYAGTSCPYCLTAALIRAPCRAALEAVKESLEEGLRVVNEALAK
jgi:hypothetical protein